MTSTNPYRVFCWTSCARSCHWCCGLSWSISHNQACSKVSRLHFVVTPFAFYSGWNITSVGSQFITILHRQYLHTYVTSCARAVVDSVASPGLSRCFFCVIIKHAQKLRPTFLLSVFYHAWSVSTWGNQIIIIPHCQFTRIHIASEHVSCTP